MTNYTHYTNFGLSIQPPCADAMGFLEYREGFEALDQSEWTQAEWTVFRAGEAIDAWRAES